MICLFCKTETKNKKYCSIKCQQQHKSFLCKQKRTINKCIFCNKDTYNEKYCSKICFNKDMWKKGIIGKDIYAMTHKMHEANFGKCKSEETRRKISQTKLKKSKLGLYNKWNPWCKNLKKENSIILQNAAKKASETINLKGGAWSKGLTKHCDLRLKKMSENLSKTQKELFKNGIRNNKAEKNPMFGKTHTAETIEKIIQKRSYTKPETIFRKILESLNIEYYHQFFITENKKTYAYDFKIKNKNILIEIDGDYWHGGPKYTKHFFKVDEIKKNDLIKNQIAELKNYRIIRFWESELNDSTLIEKIKLELEK